MCVSRRVLHRGIQNDSHGVFGTFPSETNEYKCMRARVYNIKCAVCWHMQANKRAKAANKKAYCHLVGLGLGAWAVHGSAQKQIYMDAVASDLFVSFAFG